jgi:hypothetical protein
VLVTVYTLLQQAVIGCLSLLWYVGARLLGRRNQEARDAIVTASSQRILYIDAGQYGDELWVKAAISFGYCHDVLRIPALATAPSGAPT